LGLFFALQKINRTSLAPSFTLTAFLFSAAGVLMAYLYESFENAAARWLLVILALPFIIAVTFGAYAAVGFLFLNTRAILKKETRRLSHCLTLILALGIIAYAVTVRVIDADNAQPIIGMTINWLRVMALCYFIHVTQYVTATVLCNLYRPKKNQDYIIVHGSGLKSDGSVTPLLAGRVDRAIKLYNAQKAVGKPPKLILSGGRGSDERRSEAEAMAQYAGEKGVPEGDLLLEDKSTTTLENMIFSKRLMDGHSGGRAYNAVYATSDYHLLRTGIYARRAGMKLGGIGSKTAFYYLPNALLREYIAYIVLHWKWNAAFAGLSFLLALATGLLLTFYGQ